MSQPQPLVPCSRLAVTALLVAIGHARLGGGTGVIGRRRVTPKDWARFRAFDAERDAKTGHIINELNAKSEPAQTDVEIVLDRRQIRINGSYHLRRAFSVPELRAIRWLAGPERLEVIEFGLLSPRGRTGGVTLPDSLPERAGRKALPPHS
jgi:hypothetical protein